MYKLYIICSFGKTCALPECETNRCEFKVKRSIFKVLSDNDHDPDNNNNNNSNCSNTFKWGTQYYLRLIRRFGSYLKRKFFFNKSKV